MRPIDADRLLTDRMKSMYYHLPNGDTAIPLIDIEHAPTIEPQRPHGEWIPITYRQMDKEEYEEFRKEFGEIPIEDRKMFSCQMPEDNQEILICTSWGGVNQDRCEIDEYGYALETQGDWDGVTAWMPLPEPYQKEGD